jgi:hypothetical protein
MEQDFSKEGNAFAIGTGSYPASYYRQSFYQSHRKKKA